MINATETQTLTATTKGFTPVTFSILAILLLILCFLIVLIALQLRRSNREQEALRERRFLFLQRPQQQRQQRPSIEDRIQRRYETIEHWLITKHVVGHNSVFCERVLDEQKTFSTSDNASEPFVNHSLPSSDKECSICITAFQTNDIVSWSANPSCCHVYHHECIKEWLLRRKFCPYCREIVLPCDLVASRNTLTQLHEWSQLYTNRSSSMYYCVQDGLMVLSPLMQRTAMDLEKQWKEIVLDTTLKPEDLLMLRGQRQEGTLHNFSKVEEDDGDLPEVEDASEHPYIDSTSIHLSQYPSLEDAIASNTDQSTVENREEEDNDQYPV